MSKPQHTPTPWFIHNCQGRLPNVIRRPMANGEADTYYSSIHGPDKSQVVTLDWGYGSSTDEADVEFIVRAVNAHDRLVKILELVLLNIEPIPAKLGGPNWQYLSDEIKKALEQK